MTEEDYINVTNLQKLMTIKSLLNDIICCNGVCIENELKCARRIIHSQYEKTVGVINYSCTSLAIRAINDV